MSNLSVHTFALLLALSFDQTHLDAQKNKGASKAFHFSWNNPPEKATLKNLPSNLRHFSFKSKSMGIDVGYYILFPKSYHNPEAKKERYPVVYHLHGGRPGGEKKSITLSTFIDQAISKGQIQPTIYVFPNGGPMSWYNYPQKKNGMGEDIFINELIPHIDKIYRTLPFRKKRGLQGFSQGGRGTTRIMFRHPQLFGSVAPGGSGYEPEERIRDTGGNESEHIRFSKGYDAWSLAKKHSMKKKKYPVAPLIWVGTLGFNYKYNLKYMKYLDQLGIKYRKLIVVDAPHSAQIIYQKKGLELMKFHDQNFGK